MKKTSQCSGSTNILIPEDALICPKTKAMEDVRHLSVMCQME